MSILIFRMNQCRDVSLRSDRRSENLLKKEKASAQNFYMAVFTSGLCFFSGVGITLVLCRGFEA